VASAARGAILIRVRALILLPLAVVMTAAEPSIQVVDHVRLAVSGGNREVECLVFYPDALAPTALVVFSHDLGRSRGAYWYLGEAWARTGLVAVFPTHASSDRAMIKQVGMLSVLDALRTAARDPQVWEERAADLAAVVAAGPEGAVAGGLGRGCGPRLRRIERRRGRGSAPSPGGSFADTGSARLHTPRTTRPV
jgi:hypothetical protein